MSLLQHPIYRNKLSGDGLKAQLIRGGLGSAGVQAVNRFLALALGIVLARSLGTEGYGIYAYAFAIMSLLLVLAEAGVPTLLMREIAASQGGEEWGLLRGALRCGLQSVALVATCVSVMGLLVLWWRVGSLPLPVLNTTAFMLLVLPALALCKTVAHVLCGLHRVVIGQAIVMLIRPLLVLVIVGTGFLLWPNLREPHYAMVGQLVSAIVVLLIGALTLQRLLPAEVKTSVPEYRSREWFRSALPFTLIGGAGVINSHADIVLLGWFVSNEDVGIYRVAVQGASLVAFGLQAVNSIVAPQFAKLYAQHDTVRLQRLVTSSARVVLLAALPFALLFTFGGGLVAEWVFGAEFSKAHAPLAILAVGQLINAAFGSVGFLLNMTGHERVVFRILWQTALFNLVMNFVLIPLIGMSGAAIATAITLMIWNFLLYREVISRLSIFSTAFRSL